MKISQKLAKSVLATQALKWYSIYVYKN